MSSADSNEDPIAEAASRWIARQDRGLTPGEEIDLLQWLEVDPRHTAEYERLTLAWSRFDRAKAAPELAEMARELELQTRVRPSRRLFAGWRTLGIAAAAAVVLGASGWAWFNRSAIATKMVAEHYRVIPHAVQRLVLEDGSVAELRGAESRLDTQFSTAERRVTLVRGEAFFEVAKNPTRPFIVTAGRVTLRAVGTAFNVQLGAASVAVVVTEGKVSLGETLPPAVPEAIAPPPANADATPNAPLLVAGQYVVLNREGTVRGNPPAKIESLTPAEIDETLAWQSTWLVFDETPLADTIAAFNRHGTQRLTLGDDSLRERRLTGKFRADHVDGFIRLLERTMNIRAERHREGEIVLTVGP